jgi:hypothetical protein
MHSTPANLATLALQHSDDGAELNSERGHFMHVRKSAMPPARLAAALGAGKIHPPPLAEEGWKGACGIKFCASKEDPPEEHIAHQEH